jgi:hypothetical protein
MLSADCGGRGLAGFGEGRTRFAALMASRSIAKGNKLSGGAPAALFCPESHARWCWSRETLALI